MRKNINIFLSIIVSSIIVFNTSCRNKDEIKNPGTVLIEVNHVWGMNESTFTMNTPMVHPMTGDTLTFTNLRYYVSNIKLKKNDGTWWSEPNSYHIVDAKLNPEIDLSDIPAGSYTDMKYTMGVDSARNVSGVQDGALAVTEGMFWTWNSGYIMMKAEGTAPNSSTTGFTFHLGGFSGANNIVTEKDASFGGALLVVEEGKYPAIHMKANPAKLWHSSPSVSVVNTVHMPGAAAKAMATDFYGSVVFEELHQ